MLQERRRLGPYEIRHRLGGGAMGEVYAAFDTRLRREVALKVLVPGADGGGIGLILREARLAATLNHPNVCTIFEAGEIEGQPFIAMANVEGETLSAVIARGQLSPERVARLATQIAGGLAAAHARGIVHRDLKSANIVVGADGHVTILDFGIAVRTTDDAGATASTVTATGAGLATPAIAGTLGYMAPEVLRGGTAGVSSDVWSLGVVLFEMLAGRRPFDGATSHETMSSILLDPVPALPSHVPAGLQAIVARSLAKAPGERYQQASEVKAALEAAGAVSTMASAGPSSIVGSVRRWKWVAGLLLTLALAIAATVAWRGRATPPDGARQIRAIAVLPLANLSGDASQDFFADGMTEALITDLARVKGLAVISRTSVMQYRTAPKPVRDVARELTVDAVIEGSIIRDGDRVRISAQLIDPASDRHLWANDYDRDMRDVLSLQRDVATAIAREIRATLTPADVGATSSVRSVNPEAFDLYLKGNALVFRYNEPAIAEAIALLTRAVAIEPDFAQAWAALASAHSERGIWGSIGSRETAERAREAITRALALDANQAEAYATLANINIIYNWDWAAAERAAKRAIELAPGNGRPHQVYASLLQALRRFPEATAEAAAHRRLDPASPLAASNLARVLYRARRFDEALATFQQAIALDPSYGPNYARLADVHIAQGRYDEALRTLDRGQQVLGGTRRQTDGYALAFALAGRRSEAEAVLKDLLLRARSSDQVAYSIAQVETALGRPDEAFRWLERAFEQHSATLWLVNSELKFDAIRGDPRFQDLLRRMNLLPPR